MNDTKPKNSINYLRKSIITFRLYCGLLIFSLIASTLTRPYKDTNVILFEIIVAIPFLIFIVLVPFGLYYGWKSYKNNEEPRKKRTIFLMGHAFFFTLIIMMIIGLIIDLSKL